MSFKAIIHENTARIEMLHQRMHGLVADRERSPADRARWVAACEEFHASYDALAFPGGAGTARARLRAGENDAIEFALDFLEIRPRFFRSGYMYKDFMRVLRNCPLTAEQRQRYDVVRESQDQDRRCK